MNGKYFQRIRAVLFGLALSAEKSIKCAIELTEFNDIDAKGDAVRIVGHKH